MSLVITKYLAKTNKRYIALSVFAILIATIYGNTLKNGYIYDDVLIVPQNPYIQSLKYLPKVITGCMWEHTYYDQCKGRALYYRPIHTLSYILSYQISSEPWFFHLVNLIYFFAIVILVFILAELLTNNFIFSFVAAFFFLIHPLNSEVVNWIAALPELTFAIFVLLSTIFYIKYRQTKIIKKFWLAAVFYFLSILSKEPAIFLPFIFVMIDLILFETDIEDYFKWKEIRNYLVLGIFMVIYLIMRLAVLGDIFPRGKSPFVPFSLTERFYSAIILFGEYLRRFFYPLPLNFFYYFQKTPHFLSFKFLAFLALALLFGVAVFFSLKKKRKLLLFSLTWIFFLLLPVLIFIDAAGESVFSERYAFVPIIGFCFVFSYVFCFLWLKNKRFRIWLVFFLLFLTLFSIPAIINRNLDWRDNETFYKKTLSLNPNATPIRFNYAVMLRNEKNDFEAAKIQLEEIVKRNPNWPDLPMVYLHLGDYYQQSGEEQGAIDYYQKAAEFSEDWKTHFAYNRLGVFYAKKEEYLKALIYFCQAVQVNPDSKEIQGNFERAISIIDFNYKDNQDLLYNEITRGDSFSKKAEEKIKFRDQFCEKDICSFVFQPSFEDYEVVLPFLVMAGDSKGQAVKIENSFLDQNKGAIVLELDSKYKEETLNFIFPTCEGIYYEVAVK